MKIETAAAVAKRALERGNPFGLCIYRANNGQYMTGKPTSNEVLKSKQAWEMKDFVTFAEERFLDKLVGAL